MNHAAHVCLRRALVWLMLLAIPFQGIASAGMVACAHAAATVAVMAPHQEAPPAHCHEAAKPSGHGQDQHHDQDHDERCSACAACCIGAAMAGAPTIPAAPQTLSARLAEAPTGRLEAVDLALPERPPRLPLA